MSNNLVKVFLILAFSSTQAIAKSHHHHDSRHHYEGRNKHGHHHHRARHRHWQAQAPQDSVTCLANAVYREARNSYSNLQAVANVAKNRLMSGWGHNYCHVISTGRFVYRVSHPNPEQYAKAREVAEKVIAGELPDNTGGAVYFHSERLRHLPKWAKHEFRTARIAGNVFYRDSSTEVLRVALQD